MTRSIRGDIPWMRHRSRRKFRNRLYPYTLAFLTHLHTVLEPTPYRRPASVGVYPLVYLLLFMLCESLCMSLRPWLSSDRRPGG